jgi:hypothetical protein
MVETFEEVGKYSELGEVPDIEGKHRNIKILHDVGLEVPDSIVVAQNYEVGDLDPLIDHLLDGEKEIILRSEFAVKEKGNERNAPSIRDASKSKEDVLDAVAKFIQNNSAWKPIVIIQGLFKNSINSDMLSANIQFKNTPIGNPPYYKYKYIPRETEIEIIEATPDIAPLINRMNLTPPILYRNGKVTTQKSPLLWDMILYRVGREEYKKRGHKVSKLEDLPVNFNENSEIQEIMSEGKLALKEKADEYPGPAYWNEFWEDNLKVVPKEIEELLKEEEARIKQIVTKADFPFNQGILKMSFLQIAGKVERYYWDMLELKTNF